MAPASDRFDVLRRRLSYFLADARGGRSSVGELIRRLGDLGEVAIVGGMLRDLLLKDDYGAFSSDVDIVVDAPDTPKLRAVLLAHGAVGNRFGGYALETGWRSDVWQLPKTWARVQGHRRVDKVDDLLQTTFFNWDAVIYSTSQRRFAIRPGYLEDLDRRRLDIVLEANPNPLGSCVRTLRSAIWWRAEVSPRLAAFASEIIGRHGAAELLEAEARSFGNSRMLNAEIVRSAAVAYGTAAREGIYARPLAEARPGTLRQVRLPLDAEPPRRRGRKRKPVLAAGERRTWEETFQGSLALRDDDLYWPCGSSELHDRDRFDSPIVADAMPPGLG